MYNYIAIYSSLFFLVILLFIFTLTYYIETQNEPFDSKENSNEFKYTAVIIEPREHKALPFVLKNFLENLSEDWSIIVMHGNQNLQYIQDIIHDDLSEYTHRIQLHPLHVDNLTIDDYNQLLFSEEFYDAIPTEIFLIFQTDTMICPSQKELIQPFLKYDYVGAPWIWNQPNDKSGGNGGLSLRKKSVMLDKLRNCQITNKEYEDMFFSNSCHSPHFPSNKKAKEFSVETVYHDKSFGVHKPWNYLSEEQLNTLQQNCTGLKRLIDLNQ